MNVDYTVCSSTGLHRPRNEDAHVALPEHGLFAVIDGMGGHADGDVAADTAASVLCEHAANVGHGCDLRRLIVLAHEAVSALPGAGQHRAPGATIVVCRVVGDTAEYCWAGDSRLYRWRDGAIEQLTQDHAAWGGISLALGHMDTDALPSVRVAKLRAGDALLLCTDGLTRHVPDKEIAALLSEGAEAVHLVNAANAGGGTDNTTVIVVRVSA